MLLVVRPGAPSSDALVPSSKVATSSYLLLVVMPLLLASKDATSSYLLLVVIALVTSSFMFLVARTLLVAICY